MRQYRKKIKRIAFPIFIFLVAVIFSLRFWAQEDCVEYPGIFSESFDNTEFKDEAQSSVANWGGGYITLNRLGANFKITNPNGMPTWINTVAANDFDGDGWPDFIGSSSSYSNVLALVKNMGIEGSVGTFEISQWIDGSNGSGSVPTLGVKGAAIDTSGHCGMTSGDYDGDGDYDFLFIVSSTSSPYSLKRIWLYRNDLKETGTCTFSQTNLTSKWSNSIKGIAWSATMMVSIDFDKDGDVDILIGNKDGKVLLLRNRNNQQVDGNTFVVESSAVISTGWGLRGVSAISVADFDADEDLDIVVGSVSYRDLKYYKNDGTGHFTFYKRYQDLTGNLTNNDYDGAATVSICDDFDRDGDVDLMIGTDEWNYPPNTGNATGYGGTCFYFRNSNGEFKSSLIFDYRPTVFDFDLGAVLDFDHDGDNDFLIADGNHSERYYLFINGLADVYNLRGTAVSTNLTPNIDPRQQAITKVRIRNLDLEVFGGSSEGLAVEVYVSNNDGRDWEFYAKFEGTALHTYSDLAWHTFNHFGSKLKWKAILSATEDQMEEYTGASFETPAIDLIGFEYIFVDRMEISRTSVVATTILDENNQTRKLIIGGTFYFPGWEGHLRAYDLSEMSPENSMGSVLRTISQSNLQAPSGREIPVSGVEILWDAGEILNLRQPGDRIIFTALRGEYGYSRLDFSPANVSTLEPILQDFNNDNLGLINFVRGEGRDWKLGDIDHSNPLLVGPPLGDSSQMGGGYSAFAETWKAREKVLYVGTNDGMLHCFEVETGEELWGFIPYNLLPKLKNMWAVDKTTNDRYFARDIYVDGSPVAADIQINGNWKTILVCAQGPGRGSILGGGINYYFALDITDPRNPLPLWELTSDSMGETWSVPAIGKVTVEGNPAWVAFTGSGYDNNPDLAAGHVFYAVNLENGTSFWSFAAPDVDTSKNYPNIPNAIPGSPSLVDVDQNGYADYVYVGDLDGRLWKVNVSNPFSTIEPTKTTWDGEVKVIYQDSNNYPILCKPACWFNPVSGTTIPRIYFGTGGDDRAPAAATYSFVGLLDSSTPEVEWYMGNSALLNLPLEKKKGELSPGEKVWASPVIGDYVVYFSTLTGSIESVDPCLNLAGIGKLYARFVEATANYSIGASALTQISSPLESLDLVSKSRSAVTLGERQTGGAGIRKREVYIQEYNSAIQKLEQPIASLLKVKSWREVYKIVK